MAKAINPFDRNDHFTCLGCGFTYPDRERANPREVAPVCADCDHFGRA